MRLAAGPWAVRTAAVDYLDGRAPSEELTVTFHGWVWARIVAHRDPANPGQLDAATMAQLAAAVPAAYLARLAPVPEPGQPAPVVPIRRNHP